MGLCDHCTSMCLIWKDEDLCDVNVVKRTQIKETEISTQPHIHTHPHSYTSSTLSHPFSHTSNARMRSASAWFAGRIISFSVHSNFGMRRWRGMDMSNNWCTGVHFWGGYDNGISVNDAWRCVTMWRVTMWRCDDVTMCCDDNVVWWYMWVMIMLLVWWGYIPMCWKREKWKNWQLLLDHRHTRTYIFLMWLCNCVCVCFCVLMCGCNFMFRPLLNMLASTRIGDRRWL